MRTITRAIVRGGIEMVYSQGFNPHPRISLPLPKSVGVEAEDELAGICIELPDENESIAQLESRIAEQLPSGCTLIGLEIREPNVSFAAAAAVYVLPIQPAFLTRIAAAVQDFRRRLGSGDSIVVERRIDERGNIRSVNVTHYVESFELTGNELSVKCNISPSGTIRIEEIMRLFGCDPSMLAGPIRRTFVQWIQNN